MTGSFSISEQESALALIAAALREDLDEAGDLTGNALLPADAVATVHIVARRPGVLAGLPVARLVFRKLDENVEWTSDRSDGESVDPGDIVARLTGPVRSLLAGERTALNFLTHLSGVATETRRFVDAAAESTVAILDTRKTLPGYRLLQKYAVRCGGGTNHRMGLFDAILIKDNHLAFCADRQSLPDTVRAAKTFAESRTPRPTVETEVDSLEQLRQVLKAGPDIVLLDNMSVELLRESIRLRDEMNPDVRLEASGGVTLETVRGIAETGVERISIGALTHSAPALDLAFDWPR